MNIKSSIECILFKIVIGLSHCFKMIILPKKYGGDRVSSLGQERTKIRDLQNFKAQNSYHCILYESDAETCTMTNPPFHLTIIPKWFSLYM
jgi:hypothetical protein